MPKYHPQKVQVAALIDQWLQRAHLTQIAVVQELLAQGLVVSDKSFHQWYKNPRRAPSTDQAMALGIVRVFAHLPLRQERCTASEALRFLALTRVPLECCATIKPWFAPEEWNQAVESEAALLRAHLGEHRVQTPSMSTAPNHTATNFALTLLPMRNIRLDDVLLKQGPHPVQAYFERSIWSDVRVALRAACRQGQGGIVLYGPPMVGKTRMALEALRHEAGNFVLFPWPLVALDPAQLLPLRHQRVILFLDDIQELVRRQVMGDVVVAVHTLQQIAQATIIVATCRSGGDQESVLREFGTLIEQLMAFDLKPMARESAEWVSFYHFLDAVRQQEPNRQIAATQFDGTPGSVFLGLGRRTRQLRGDARFPAGAKAILKALALLRAAAIYEYPEARVRRVVEGVFQIQGSWVSDLDYLLQHDWIHLERSPHLSDKQMHVPTDAYLDTCLPDAGIYPQPGLRVQDDLLALVPVLAGDPPDVHALFRLSRALYFEDQGHRAALMEGALTAAQAGLAVLAADDDPQLWGEGYLALGRAYWLRTQGQRADNLERALAALRSAEEAFPYERFPYEWAEVQRSLGHVLTDIESGDRSEHIEQAIACYEATLRVQTREDFPYQWARLQGNLGNAHADRLRGNRAEHLEQSIAHYQAALSIFTREVTPVDWAREHVKLGEAYCRRVQGDREENIARAIAAYTSALEVFTQRTYPFQWAFIQYDLGDALLRRREGDRTQHHKAAIAHYHQALTILTAREYPFWHALIHLSLGHTYREYLAGDPAANIEQALSCYAVAATTLTRTTSPIYWAALQIGYGKVYLRRQQGDQVRNLQTACASFEAALAVYTSDAYPHEWAEAAHELGQIYVALAEAALRTNNSSAYHCWISKAITAWQATLEVFTAKEFPDEHARSRTALARLEEMVRDEALVKIFQPASKKA